MLCVLVIRQLHHESPVTLLIVGIPLVFTLVALFGKYLDGYTIAGNEQRVSQGDDPFRWPLIERQGVLSCDKTGAITFTSRGTRYGMNDRALNQQGVINLKAILKADPSDKSKEMDWRSLRNTALSLCK